MTWSRLRTVDSVQRNLLRGEKRSLEREEGVSDGAERRVMMKAAPCSSFEMVEANLLL